MRLAHDAGVNFFFFYGPSHLRLFERLKSLLGRARPDIVVACGSGSRSPEGLERARRTLARLLATELLDVFFAEYVSPSDDPSKIFGEGGVLDLLRAWRDAGVIRYVGASTHDADLALRLVADGRVDVLMLRFNMAHRRVGRATFPAARRARVPVVAYTATRWGTLLDGHPEWTGPAPSECYRYCLAQPAVQVVLTAPTSVAEAEANLDVLRRPALPTARLARWEAYGDLVHGNGAGKFETMWP